MISIKIHLYMVGSRSARVDPERPVRRPQSHRNGACEGFPRFPPTASIQYPGRWIVPVNGARTLPLLSRLLLPLLLMALPLAAEERTLELADGSEIPIIRAEGRGPDRLLWIPTEYGMRAEAHRPLAEAIAAGGPEVWVADLHGAWFLLPGRSSYLEVDPEAIAELIERARPEGGRLYLLSAGRGAALTLMAARQWRLDHPDAPPLGGAVLIHPNLLAATPEPGKPAPYLPIARASNLPIQILQPQDSAKRWHLESLVEALTEGGATVYSRLVPQVSDGYQVRADAYDRELEARKKLPRLIHQSRRLLDRHNRAPRPAAPLPEGDADAWQVGPLDEGLRPYPGSPIAPPLALTDLEGNRVRLADYRDQVVLLNFWATWCPPCVEEIPSLGRLQLELTGEPFVVLGVDVGESAETVNRFLGMIPADYPVLLDPDGEAVAPWKLRAFPTTFLIDREGRIRYAYFGGLEWDAPPVVKTIKKLLN